MACLFVPRAKFRSFPTSHDPFPKPDLLLTMLTHYMLENSRAIRVEWALRELDVEHETKTYKRVNGKKAPPEMAKESGLALGKSPAIRDGDYLLVESSAILIYLAEKYDKSNQFLPGVDQVQDRADTMAWLGFAEGALMLHGLPVTYATWFLPDDAKTIKDDFTIRLKTNIVNDLEHVESCLRTNFEKHGATNGQGAYLIGENLTIADIQMLMSCQYIYSFPTLKQLMGLDLARFTHVRNWMKGLEAREKYRDATQVSAYVFNSE